MKKWFKKSSVGVGLATGFMVASAAPSYAAADQATVDAMTAGFGDIVSTGLLAIGGLAVVGLTIFGAMYAWKLGRKVFSMVAK